MKFSIAVLLLVVLTVNSGYGQVPRPVPTRSGPAQRAPAPAQRAPAPNQRAPAPNQRAPAPNQRAPAPGQGPRVTPTRIPAVTQPVRQQAPSLRPTPTRVQGQTTTTPRRQGGGGPPIPTASPRNTTPRPPVTTARPPVTQRPDESTPRWPTAPIVDPNIPPVTLPSGRLTTRPPRIGLEGRPDPRCPTSQNSRNPVHLPHQTNCERFFKCDHGLAYEYQCPVGQHWNVRRNYCDFPQNANCGGTNWNWNDNDWNRPVNPPNNNNNNNNWNNDWNNNWDNNNNWNVPVNPPNNNWGNNWDFVHPIQIPMAPGK